MLLLVASALPASGAGDDCAAGPAGAVITRSSFAHGYLHGYEAGFHTGDLDFHLARHRNPRDLREAENVVGYRRDFGARASFSAGFRRGFLAGYEDSVSGRDFRAFTLLAGVSAADLLRPADFDQGFQDGYKAGDGVGRADLDADSDFDPSRVTCPAKPAGDGRLPPSSQGYCAGYVRAYRLGYTDGFVYTSPADRGAVLATK